MSTDPHNIDMGFDITSKETKRVKEAMISPIGAVLITLALLAAWYRSTVFHGAIPEGMTPATMAFAEALGAVFAALTFSIVIFWCSGRSKKTFRAASNVTMCLVIAGNLWIMQIEEARSDTLAAIDRGKQQVKNAALAAAEASPEERAGKVAEVLKVAGHAIDEAENAAEALRANERELIALGTERGRNTIKLISAVQEQTAILTESGALEFLGLGSPGAIDLYMNQLETYTSRADELLLYFEGTPKAFVSLHIKHGLSPADSAKLVDLNLGDSFEQTVRYWELDKTVVAMLHSQYKALKDHPDGWSWSAADQSVRYHDQTLFDQIMELEERLQNASAEMTSIEMAQAE